MLISMCVCLFVSVCVNMCVHSCVCLCFCVYVRMCAHLKAATYVHSSTDMDICHNMEGVRSLCTTVASKDLWLIIRSGKHTVI